MKSNFKFAMRHLVVAMMTVAAAACSESEDEKETYNNNYYYQDETINSIAAVTNIYTDGLPTFSAESSQYYFSEYFTSEAVSTLELRYRINPTNASIEGIEWGLISRTIESRAEGDVVSELELEVVSYEDGELVLTIAKGDIDEYDSISDIGNTAYALVAEYSEEMQVVSDFCYIGADANIEKISVEEVALESDDAELTLFTDYAYYPNSSLLLTGAYTFSLDAYGYVDEENRISFAEIGFEDYSIVYSLYESEDYTYFQINDGVLSLIEGEYNAADLKVVVKIVLYDAPEEGNVVKTYYASFNTEAKEEFAEAVIDNGIYYTDGDNYSGLSGSVFADYDNRGNYEYTFYSDSDYESPYSGSTNSVIWGATSNDVFTYSVDKSNLSTGSNYVYIRFVNTITGKVYVYVYIIYVSAVPTNVEPTVETTVETFGYLPESGYMQTELFSYFTNESSVTSSDENVTFKVYLTGTNASKATLYNINENFGVDSVTGTLKNFYSTIKDYTVRLNSSLSNDDMTVNVMVDIMRTGVEAESTDEGTVTFKNPISLTTGTSYTFNENTCNMSTDVVVKFMTDSNPEGLVVYQDGSLTGDYEKYGITVSYTTETGGFSVNGTTLSGETAGTFNVSVKSELYDNIYASKAQSYIKVSYDE